MLFNYLISLYSNIFLLLKSSLGKVESSGGAFNIIFNSLKAGLNGVKETVNFVASKVAQEASLGMCVWVCVGGGCEGEGVCVCVCVCSYYMCVTIVSSCPFTSHIFPLQ